MALRTPISLFMLFFDPNPSSAKARASVRAILQEIGVRLEDRFGSFEYRYPLSLGNFALRQSSGAAPARYVYLEARPRKVVIAEGGPKWSGGEASAIGTPPFGMCRGDRANPFPGGKGQVEYMLLTPVPVYCQADFFTYW